MSTWFLSENNSDLSDGPLFNRDLVLATETAGTIDFEVPGQSTRGANAYSIAGDINDADWSDGDITVEINVTTASMNLFARVRAEHLQNGGTFIESWGQTPEQAMSSTGVLTFTIPNEGWTAGSSNDRLGIEFFFRNSHMNAQSVGIETGTTDTEVDAPLILAGVGGVVSDLIMGPGIIPFER